MESHQYQQTECSDGREGGGCGSTRESKLVSEMAYEHERYDLEYERQAIGYDEGTVEFTCFFTSLNITVALLLLLVIVPSSNLIFSVVFACTHNKQEFSFLSFEN